MRLIIGIAVLLCLLSGCSSTRIVERVRIDTLRVLSHEAHVREVSRVDTLVVLDSVVVAPRGDTIWVERWRVRERVREVARIDTLTRVDTLYRSVGSHEVNRSRVRGMGGSRFVCVLIVLFVVLVAILWWLLRKR